MIVTKGIHINRANSFECGDVALIVGIGSLRIVRALLQ